MSHSHQLPCSPIDFTLGEDCEEKETIPNNIKINPSEIIQLLSLFRNITPFSENLLLAIVEKIKKDNEWTFNPMKDKELDRLQEVLNGQDDSLKPRSLLRLADHLVAMDEYDFSLFICMEALLVSLKIYEMKSNPKIVWLIQNGLLGIAKIIRNGRLVNYLEDYVNVSCQIFSYLERVFDSEEASCFLQYELRTKFQVK